jgi:hypothetical protein
MGTVSSDTWFIKKLEALKNVDLRERGNTQQYYIYND